MEAKEKARQLFETFTKTLIIKSSDHFNYGSVAKECALICVDEILESYSNVFDDFIIDSKKTGGFRNMKKYWLEVKQEILNL